MYHRNCGWLRTLAYAHAQERSQRTFHESRAHGRGGFGVRRPLRYLGYKLDLDDGQMRRVAVVLDRLKTEREQAKLDESRTVSELATLVTKDGVTVDELTGALAPRLAVAERLQATVARAVFDILAVLDPDQREEFSYLLSNRELVL